MVEKSILPIVVVRVLNALLTGDLCYKVSLGFQDPSRNLLCWHLSVIPVCGGWEMGKNEVEHEREK